MSMNIIRARSVFGGTASLLALMLASPAVAQSVPVPDEVETGEFETPAGGDLGGDAPSDLTTSPNAEPELDAVLLPEEGVIIVTAQRRAESLQSVPISVSAFTAEALEREQIENPLDLQLSLPNVTFTKTNFTSSSFTIRGIGDLCVGVTCDSATAIHINDMPIQNSRLFETEFFDLERIEVLRGPQGTLFGRNATSGVVNFISARPNLNEFQANVQGEYGNFDSIKLQGMVNIPVNDWIGVRLAGYYLNRDGYTLNLNTGNRIDGRDLYALRGTIRLEPGADTTIDLIGYYFREDDDRSRIQKQLCNRDPTGILGCSPDRLESETINGNATLATVLTSRELYSIALGPLGPTFAPLALGSVYGTDTYSGFANPTDLRTVRIDYEPTYFAEDLQLMGKLQHNFGALNLNVTGGYARSEVVSRTDYNLAVENSYANNPGLLALAAYGAAPGPFQSVFQSLGQVLIPNGPAGGICQSDADPNNVGVYGGNSIGCFDTSLDFDESSQRSRQYSLEAHIDSDFDGPFNFLLGGIWFDTKTFNNSYYVTAFGLDYAAGILGAAQTIGARLQGATTYPVVFRASPFFRSNTDYFHLKSWGLFGEGYFDVTDRLKVTVGLRYNHDDKFVRARTTLLNDSLGQAVVVPYGSDSITDAIGYAGLDFDASTPGAQEWAENSVQFDRLTGRAVVDYEITRDNMVYASYSRGYKSGGINPPLSPVFEVPVTFGPEEVDAFEIGTKNTFLDGTLRLNASAFYYKYNNLQLSRIVARTSVNDNVNADIYGVELEAVVSPTPALLLNANVSFLKSSVSSNKFLANPRDPSGGRSDAVIIKDLSTAANCAVYSPAGGAAGAQAFVNAVNAGIGAGAGNPALLQPTTPVPGTSATGAYSLCSVLQAQAAAIGNLFGGIVYEGAGIPVNIRDNELPQAPEFKFSLGAQYTFEFANGMTLVPRADLAYTSEFYASIFNMPIDQVDGFTIVNAQVQLNGADERWFVRAFVQNLFDNDAITGQYVTDQSSGLFTNIFTLEPRRYGIAAGFRF